MRISPTSGNALRQLSTEVDHNDHQRVRQHAREQGLSVQELLRKWLRPKLESLKPEKPK